MFLSVNSGRSCISSSGTSQGAHHQHFLALMVGALGSPALAPPRGPTINVFYIDGGRSQISISTHQGAHHQYFFALMVGAFGSPALASPRGPGVDVFILMVGAPRSPSAPVRGLPSMFLCVDGGCPQISSTAYQGPHCRRPATKWYHGAHCRRPATKW
jgi:hypothetical protein